MREEEYRLGLFRLIAIILAIELFIAYLILR